MPDKSLGESLLDQVDSSDAPIVLKQIGGGVSYEHPYVDRIFSGFMMAASFSAMFFFYIHFVRDVHILTHLTAWGFAALAGVLLFQVFFGKTVVTASCGRIGVERRVLGIWFRRSIDMRLARLGVFDFRVRHSTYYGLRVLAKRERNLPVWGSRSEMEALGKALLQAINSPGASEASPSTASEPK